jgi:hypothetical protein
MSPIMLTWFTLGAIVIYAMAQDPNVGAWIFLQYKRLNLEMERRWVMLKYHPEAPWTKYSIHRNSFKLAKKILDKQKGKH